MFEHAIVFPALILGAEYTVIDDARPWRARVTAVRPLMLALIAVTLLYLLLRSHVQENFAGFARKDSWKQGRTSLAVRRPRS